MILKRFGVLFGVYVAGVIMGVLSPPPLWSFLVGGLIGVVMVLIAYGWEKLV